MRLHGHPHPAQLGLDRDRRRPREASHLRPSAQGAAGSRPGLRVAWLRSASKLYFGPPPDPLDQWRADRPIEPRSSLLQASLVGARGEWQIVRSDDGRMLTIPPVTEYQRLARGPD
jgi:hypothetical protein